MKIITGPEAKHFTKLIVAAIAGFVLHYCITITQSKAAVVPITPQEISKFEAEQSGHVHQYGKWHMESCFYRTWTQCRECTNCGFTYFHFTVQP